MKRIFFSLLLTILFFYSGQTVYAAELEPEITSSKDISTSSITDNSHKTSVKFNKGDTITISSTNGTYISGIYISWDSEPMPWTLYTDFGYVSCGVNGFLHEYITFENPSASLTIEIPQNNTKIDTIRIFSEGELPADVQVWEPACEKADIMVISTHADDEILFMGGVLPTYTYLYNAEIQVIYLCEFRSTNQDVREHEKLDGLWEAGIRHYPVSGDFTDKYAKDYTAAKKIYKESEVEEFFTEQIRRFQPQVVVTHDTKGEYGHGAHILVCNTVLEAINHASNSIYHPDSVQKYGTWDVPKTYLHLYPEHKIRLDLHIPIEEDYAKRPAIEILKAAYKKHVSQQYCWFYVSDDYEYSCADFGLVRSLVGPDTANDLLCNLKTYRAQEEETTLNSLKEQQKIEEELKQQEELSNTLTLLQTEQTSLTENLNKLEKQIQEKDILIQELETSLNNSENSLAMVSEQLLEKTTEAITYSNEVDSLTQTVYFLKIGFLLICGMFVGVCSIYLIKKLCKK